MSKSNAALDKHLKDWGDTALLIIDVFNSLEFKEGPKLLTQAIPAVKQIAKLKARVKKLNYPVIYCNDNFGHWRSSWEETVALCKKDSCLGEPLTQLISVEDDDYFVLKPKHSAFHFTVLEVLLQELGIKKLIITGLAGNFCVLFTANDAHMRNYKIWVPRDCIASNTKEANELAIEELKLLKVRTNKSNDNIKF